VYCRTACLSNRISVPRLHLSFFLTIYISAQSGLITARRVCIARTVPSQDLSVCHTPVGILLSPLNIILIFTLEWWGYLTVEKFWGYVQRCRQNTSVWQTDRQTSCDDTVRAMHTRRAVKMTTVFQFQDGYTCCSLHYRFCCFKRLLKATNIPVGAYVS